MHESRTERLNAFRKAFGNPNSRVNDDVTKWLCEHGFFDAPASSSHHLNRPGGLFEHSSNVSITLIVLTRNNNLQWQDPESPMIVGMFHDLCEIDMYKETDDGYAFASPILAGHGDKSVMMLSTLMRLTEEEMYCIRYHMGAFSDSAEERFAYGRAVQKYPNVLFTHTADVYASNVYEAGENNA